LHSASCRYIANAKTQNLGLAGDNPIVGSLDFLFDYRAGNSFFGCAGGWIATILATGFLPRRTMTSSPASAYLNNRGKCVLA
jgi:hypothetical protein